MKTKSQTFVVQKLSSLGLNLCIVIVIIHIRYVTCTVPCRYIITYLILIKHTLATVDYLHNLNKHTTINKGQESSVLRSLVSKTKLFVKEARKYGFFYKYAYQPVSCRQYVHKQY